MVKSHKVTFAAVAAMAVAMAVAMPLAVVSACHALTHSPSKPSPLGQTA